MNMYIFLPICGYLCSGILKFLINTYKYGIKGANEKKGNGGFPSTHCATVTTPLVFIGYEEGFNSPIFSLGLAFLIITIIDATGIRRAIGKHASILNQLNNINKTRLRESQGHNLVEISGGLVLGTMLATLIWIIY